MAVLTASFLACLVTAAGIYVINRYAAWGNKNVAHFMSFAAGVLITVSLMHILPEAYAMNNNAPMFVLIGFMSLYISNRILDRYRFHRNKDAQLSFGLIPMIGIGIHSLIDGVIYSVTFNVSIFTGLLAAIGMVMHEFPEGIITFLLLQKGGFSRRKAVIWALLAAAISTPLGTLISFPFIHTIDRSILGLLLAVSAGALLYVGATHLLPAIEEEERKCTLISLFAGIAVAVIIVISKG
ncbi:ZIP family metal transporter [bacterium]|nr:MAG: ZIP family metal transporter [bacterium]